MKKMRSLFYRSTPLAICLALLAFTLALAASGDLDTTFSGDGRIVQGFGSPDNWGRDVAVQADGKVVAVGEKSINPGRSFAVARYTPAGVLDTTFSWDGRQTILVQAYDRGNAVVIQADGKIVLAGEAHEAGNVDCNLALVRLNPNGSLDTGFGTNGKVITDFASGNNSGLDVAMQGNKIVVAGYLYTGSNYNAAVYRYNSNGSLDTTFSGDGIQPVNFGQDDYFESVKVSSGKIYLAGYSESSSGSDIIVARLNSNGTLDPTFSGDGKVKTDLDGGWDIAYDLVISGGKIVVAGRSSDSIAILRYTASGVLDPTFSGDGMLVTNLGLPAPGLDSVTLQGGKILVAGQTDHWNDSTKDALLARFTTAGAPDPTFGAGGFVTTDWGGGERYYSVLFGNSRIYAVGGSEDTAGVGRFIVAGYLP